MSGGCAPAPWRWAALAERPEIGGDFTPLALYAQPAAPDPAEPDPDPADPGAAAPCADPRDAQRIIAEARARAARVQEEVARMRAQVQAHLRQIVDTQLAAFASAREELLAAARAATRERIDRLERELAGLVAEMAAKVVHRQIAADDTIVLDVVRGTLQRAAGAARITVHVAASDLPAVRAAAAELLAAASAGGELEIVADPTVEPGGCLVDTELGEFDARIATQLAAFDAEVARIVGEG